MSRRSAGASNLLPALWLGAQVVNLACELPVREFQKRVAIEDCAFSRRCTPDLWEMRCHACTGREQCPIGECDRKSGRCRDRSGLFSNQGELFSLCSSHDQCGDYLCRAEWESGSACEESQRDALERSIEECEYDEDAARECQRLLQERTCADPRPPICDFVFDRCEK
jgi:hypothetical protein